MIRQMLKAIWYKKLNNLLLIAEIIISFGILFIVTSLLLSTTKKYLVPLGYDYKNVTEFIIVGHPAEDVSEIKRELGKFREVEAVTFSSIGDPFQTSDASRPLKYKRKMIEIVRWYNADNDYAKVLSIEVSEGRWFDNTDIDSSYIPVVINRKLKNEIFGNENAINKIYETGSNKVYKIIGIVENYKKGGEFSEEEFVEFTRRNTSKEYSFLIKTNFMPTASFDEKLRKFGKAISPGCRVYVKHMEEIREKFIAPVVKQLILYVTLGAFLIINVALGLYGVLWYNISRRKQEIGIRRALGANRISIYKQITGEILFLTSFSIVIGCLLLIQFPLLEIFKIQPGIYYLSLVLSALLIYILVLLCASYPGLMASKIEPASALHDD